MPELLVDLQQRDDAVVVKMAGDASVTSIAELERQFLKLNAMHPKLVVLDLSELAFIASIGIGTIVSLQRDVARNGGSVRMAAANEDVQGAMQRSGLDKVFSFHDSVDEALQ